MSDEVWTDNRGVGVNGGSEGWRDGERLRNGGRRPRSNPIK